MLGDNPAYFIGKCFLLLFTCAESELVKKIVVHAPEKIDGKRYQQVDIIFNFVGEIHFPTEPQTMQRGGWGSDAVLKQVYRHALSDQETKMNAIANKHFKKLCNTK